MAFSLEHGIVQSHNSTCSFSAKPIINEHVTFELPLYKRTKGKMILKHVALYLSRNSDMAFCMDRIESADNNHARHLLIGQDGKVLQFASLETCIRHIPDSGYINKSNCIAVEFACSGKLMRGNGGFYNPYGTKVRRSHVKLIAGQAYEILSADQFLAFKLVMRALNKHYLTPSTIDGGNFVGSQEYKVSPLLLDKVITKQEL